MQATYTDIERLISNNKPFKGNSASAEIVDYIPTSTGRLYDDSELRQWEKDMQESTKGNMTRMRFYIVYSYSTPMLIHLLGTSGKVRPWVNKHKYSTTTSRLQNIIKQVWPEE